MALSLKAELETWAAALKAYDEQDFEKALDLFSCISGSAKILTNMGLIYATIGEHETAVEHFLAATNFDAYLAIAHFQCGVSNFLLQRYDFALLNFEDAYLYLRGNEAINYDQLGLKFKLFSAEIMFNKGLAQLNLGYTDAGITDMQEASKLKATDEHNVIDEAIRDRGEGYTVFSIPVGVLYRPSENKIKNSKSKDYLGKAKLVAASDSNDAFTEFTGAVKLQQATADSVEDKNKIDGSPLSRSISVPAPRIDPISPLPTALERAKTAVQPGAGVRPDTATILASRRTQSVSNPENVPRTPSAGNTALSRSNTARLARSGTTNAGVAPLRAKTPLGTSSVVSTDGPRVGGETGAAAAGGIPLATLRSPPSVRRLREQAQQSPPQPPQPIQLAQYVNAFPAVPGPTQGDGHLTQFYNAYMDTYTDDQAPRLMAAPHPLTAQIQSSTSSSQRQSPATATICPVPQPVQPQPQPLLQEQQQVAAWMQRAPSPFRTSGNTTASSGVSRAPSRAANANPNMGVSAGPGPNVNKEPVTSPAMSVPNSAKGSVSNASVKTHRRKGSRRPAAHRVTVYDDDEGDDGFVTGELEDFGMANIRVKLHYQDDIRGMIISSTTSYDAFVERVTSKFGTSLTGLGMKFADEEGTKISLRDEGDFELAIETAREGAKGRSEGKIEVWCVDV